MENVLTAAASLMQQTCKGVHIHGVLGFPGWPDPLGLAAVPLGPR